jgi:hypothetical protein
MDPRPARRSKGSRRSVRLLYQADCRLPGREERGAMDPVDLDEVLPERTASRRGRPSPRMSFVPPPELPLPNARASKPGRKPRVSMP